MGVTLKQLAQEAGVSLATASLALNGSAKVADATRARLEALARKYSYHPNLVARSLAGGSNRLIGVLIDSRAPQVQFRLLAFIEREAAQHGYRVMIGEAHDNVEHLHEIYNTFRQYGADGTICLAHDYPDQEEMFRKLFGKNDNMVFIGKPKLLHSSYVEIDRTEAILEAVRHLQLEGFRKIGMLCASHDYGSVFQRIAAFRNAHRLLFSDNMEPLILRLSENDMKKRMEQLFREWIQCGKIDALLMESDYEAARLCKLLKQKNIRLPIQFGVVGSDNDEICSFCAPELSSIDSSLDLQAIHAVRMLLDMLNDKKGVGIERCITVKSRLIIRESSRVGIRNKKFCCDREYSVFNSEKERTISDEKQKISIYTD